MEDSVLGIKYPCISPNSAVKDFISDNFFHFHPYPLIPHSPFPFPSKSPTNNPPVALPTFS